VTTAIEYRNYQEEPRRRTWQVGFFYGKKGGGCPHQINQTPPYVSLLTEVMTCFIRAHRPIDDAGVGDGGCMVAPGCSDSRDVATSQGNATKTELIALFENERVHLFGKRCARGSCMRAERHLGGTPRPVMEHCYGTRIQSQIAESRARQIGLGGPIG